MTGAIHEPDDATPLAPEEREGLKQSWITHRRDLNEAEQENILKGVAWARSRRFRNALDVLDDEFAKAVHRAMFGDVWKWAGSYRLTERNIGAEAHRIAVEVHEFFDDVRYWVAQATFPADEIAVRLHHRLVAIHPFPNGNGRHTRLMADLLIETIGGANFSWGGGSLTDVGILRANYIAALKAADGHDIAPLLAFARS